MESKKLSSLGHNGGVMGLPFKNIFSRSSIGLLVLNLNFIIPLANSTRFTDGRAIRAKLKKKNSNQMICGLIGVC